LLFALKYPVNPALNPEILPSLLTSSEPLLTSNPAILPSFDR